MAGSRKPRAKKPAAKAERARDRKPKLRRLDDEFREWRFEPKPSRRDLVAVVVMSFGALALGAGIYAQYLWKAAAPPGYAPYLIGLGAALLVAYAVFGQQRTAPIVVGELGVGFEREGKVDRTAWYELTGLTLEHGALRLKTAGKPFSLALAEYPSAARLVVAQALERIPDRVGLGDADVSTLGPPRAGEGQERAADPPQVTELACRASGRALSFESDVRMCGRCAALYHRAAVPARCLECRRPLKG
jgi:hypothetical protein